MVPAGHSDVSFFNEIKYRSREGAPIFLSEDVTISSNNGPLLTIVQIIKLVMSLAANSELASLFINTKEDRIL